jgi:hypothetical protein
MSPFGKFGYKCCCTFWEGKIRLVKSGDSDDAGAPAEEKGVLSSHARTSK